MICTIIGIIYAVLLVVFGKRLEHKFATWSSDRCVTEFHTSYISSGSLKTYPVVTSQDCFRQLMPPYDTDRRFNLTHFPFDKQFACYQKGCEMFSLSDKVPIKRTGFDYTMIGLYISGILVSSLIVLISALYINNEWHSINNE